MDWQPIDSAPKDGTRVLLANFAEDLETGEWGYYDGPQVAFLNPRTGLWDDGDYNANITDMNYWMPLPPPPIKFTK